MLRAATRYVKGLRDLNYEERLTALKLQSLGKRRIRIASVLTGQIIYNQIDVKATQLYKFSIRPGLRRSSLELLQERRRNSVPCRVPKFCNRLPLAVVCVTQQIAFKA